MPTQLAASRAVRRVTASPLYTVSPTQHLRSRVIRSSHQTATCRHFASHQRNDKRPNPSFFGKLKTALKSTKVEWYSIPVGLGIAVVGFTQIRKRSNTQQSGSYGEDDERPVKPMASWQVHVMTTIPLRAMSYYWGKFNEIPLPVFLRPIGFKLYSYVFGVTLDEVEKPLTEYRNLAEFFYRRLKPGSRPIDERPNVVVSPADGKVLQFGEIRATGQVEQVKGMSYSLDTLLGAQKSLKPAVNAIPDLSNWLSNKDTPDAANAVYSDDHAEFANVNGISYTLPDLLTGTGADKTKKSANTVHDASTTPNPADTVSVASEIAQEAFSSWWTPADSPERQKRLYFCVVYLAPGDYHRFHSPASWVAERRRHFAGELYSVSPYLQKRLPGLFTLNERVALLGRWKHGMFSMTAVGATNVGSIKIHFDKELRTNSFTKEVGSTEPGSFVEATYEGASALLGGQPLKKGAEVGGFNLGSTIVLVFEAPAKGKNEDGEEVGFRWTVRRGDVVKVGEALGMVKEQ